MKKSPLSKKGKSECSKLEKQCDALLTPIIKKLHPQCEACNQPTQVAHHFIEKSRSNYLRYDVENNLIALCNICHTKIHNRFGASVVGCLDVTDLIRRKRGEEWYNNLRVLAQKTIKKDIAWYWLNFQKLTELVK